MTTARTDISSVRSASAPSPAPAVVGAPEPRLKIRPALLSDVDAIVSVLVESSEAGFTLPRTPAEVEYHLGGFVVALRAGTVIGCAALETINPALAEVRSVAVSNAAGGGGVGKAMLTWLIDEARALEFDTLCLLTRAPGFFARCGFIEVEPDELPRGYVDRAIRARGRSMEGRVAMMLSL